jgi:hypothetical protein
MRGRGFLFLFLWSLSTTFCLGSDEPKEVAQSLTVDQPTSNESHRFLLHQDKNPGFDPYADERKTADDLFGRWPAEEGNRFSLAIPMRSEFGDLMKISRPQDDLYRDWLEVTAAEDFHLGRVEAINRDFVDPGRYNLLGMACDFTVCKIPDTSCVVALLPLLAACAF